MILFADRHHDGLAFSLRLLAKRLNAEIYFPIDEEWFNKGYWWIAKPYDDNPATIKQYLSLDQRYRPADGTPPLNTIKQTNPTHYEIEDLAHGDTIKAITFEQFMAMDIDVIIASIPAHWTAYTEMRNRHKPRAKVVCQLGNIYWEKENILKESVVKNLLASVEPFDVPNDMHAVFYHQEMPILPYERPYMEKEIKSFVNCLPRPELFAEYKKALWEYKLTAYGASCPDGWVNGIYQQFTSMQNSDWGYHVKPHGDGMGHVWHAWFMLGRPVITNLSDYKDKLGGKLFEHGITGIDLERGTVEENCKLIRWFSDPARLTWLSRNAYNSFREVVDYDEEQRKIENFIENLR